MNDEIPNLSDEESGNTDVEEYINNGVKISEEVSGPITVIEDDIVSYD